MFKGSLQQVGGEVGGLCDKIGQVLGGEYCRVFYLLVQTFQQGQEFQYYVVFQQRLEGVSRLVGGYQEFIQLYCLVVGFSLVLVMFSVLSWFLVVQFIFYLFILLDSQFRLQRWVFQYNFQVSSSSNKIISIRLCRYDRSRFIQVVIDRFSYFQAFSRFRVRLKVRVQLSMFVYISLGVRSISCIGIFISVSLVRRIRVMGQVVSIGVGGQVCWLQDFWVFWVSFDSQWLKRTILRSKKLQR